MPSQLHHHRAGTEPVDGESIRTIEDTRAELSATGRLRSPKPLADAHKLGASLAPTSEGDHQGLLNPQPPVRWFGLIVSHRPRASAGITSAAVDPALTGHLAGRDQRTSRPARQQSGGRRRLRAAW